MRVEADSTALPIVRAAKTGFHAAWHLFGISGHFSSFHVVYFALNDNPGSLAGAPTVRNTNEPLLGSEISATMTPPASGSRHL